MSDAAWDIYERFRQRETEKVKHALDPILFGAEDIDGADELLWCDSAEDCEQAEGQIAVALLGGLGDGGATDPLRPHADALEKVLRHVLVVGDAALREELARRLGRHKCFTLEGGGRIPWPIEGLHRINSGVLMALRRRPPPAIMTTGTRASDALLKLPADGRLIVLLGRPGAGKTSWTRFIAVHTAAEHNRRWAIFSPESQPWEQFAASCAEVFIGKPFYPRRDCSLLPMVESEIALAEKWLGEHMTMIVCDAEGKAPTLEWLLERATDAVLRDGCTDMLVDPVNEVMQDGKDDRETVYWGRFLQRWKGWSLRHGCNVWLVVHPSKPSSIKAGEKLAAPGPYEAAGSSHFANKSDLGLTLHSPDPQSRRVELHVWKSRSSIWARRGVVAEMDFEHLTGRYASIASPDGQMELEPSERWHQP